MAQGVVQWDDAGLQWEALKAQYTLSKQDLCKDDKVKLEKGMYSPAKPMPEKDISADLKAVLFFLALARLEREHPCELCGKRASDAGEICVSAKHRSSR